MWINHLEYGVHRVYDLPGQCPWVTERNGLLFIYGVGVNVPGFVLEGPHTHVYVPLFLLVQHEYPLNLRRGQLGT